LVAAELIRTSVLFRPLALGIQAATEAVGVVASAGLQAATVPVREAASCSPGRRQR
jgi:hypothetical protein